MVERKKKQDEKKEIVYVTVPTPSVETSLNSIATSLAGIRELLEKGGSRVEERGVGGNLVSG